MTEPKAYVDYRTSVCKYCADGIERIQPHDTPVAEHVLSRVEDWTAQMGPCSAKPLPKHYEELATGVDAKSRELVAWFMLEHSIPTGHGDALGDLLVSLGTYVDGLRESLARLLEAVERK